MVSLDLIVYLPFGWSILIILNRNFHKELISQLFFSKCFNQSKVQNNHLNKQVMYDKYLLNMLHNNYFEFLINKLNNKCFIKQGFFGT